MVPGKGSSTRVAAHLRRNAVAYVALFFAVTGVSWAAVKIESKDIARDAVKSKHLKNGRVTGADVSEATLDAAVLQRRVSGGCQVGESIRAISEDGNVSCEPDDVGEAPAAPPPADLSNLDASNLKSGTVPDARLAPEVSRLGQDIDSGEIASQLGVMSGRLNNLPDADFEVGFAAISGITDSAASAAAVSTLSPAVPVIASGLMVEVDEAPGAGQAWSFRIMDGNFPTIGCVIIHPATDCASSTEATIAPGSQLSFNVAAHNLAGGAPSFPPNADAMFAFNLR